MRFPLGIDDFKKIRTGKNSIGQPYFYCDKSLLIKDIIDDGADVIVLPRPRRFGKTLNISLLKYFFDIEHPENVDLFAGLKITAHKSLMENWQGKYPVIFIGFKSLKSDTVEELNTALKICIFNCYQAYTYLQTSEKLSSIDKEKIKPYFSPAFSDSALGASLKYLTEMLEKHHGQQVILLIDEYDTPLQSAYLSGFFKEAIKPFKLILGEALKGNIHLYKGVITGITRIAKENLFSDLNNLTVYDITTNKFAPYFGFLEEEIKPICDENHLKKIKSWYNGYRFGDYFTVYNPWSILNYCNNDYKLEPYWINTSGNDLIRECLTIDKMEDIRALIEGKSITVEVESHTVMDNLKGNNIAFWNLLFMSGYLTLDTHKKMCIPNKEILYFFENVVMHWFGSIDNKNIIQEFLSHLLRGNVESVQYYLQHMIEDSFGIRDMVIPKRESFYHGFLLGLVLCLKGRYAIKSNHESGKGYYDIALFPNDPIKDVGILIEVKFKQSVQKALDQIERQDYTQALKSHGCKQILSYGFSFDGKDVVVSL